jgi:iron complex transport system ATP-binding protein
LAAAKMTLLRATQLSIRIGQQQVCHGLDLTLRAGEIWGLLGANGSGKSTLLHALAGLHPLQNGMVEVTGRSIPCWSRKLLAQKLGILFQHSSYPFPQTVRDFCSGGRHPHLTYFQALSRTDHAKVTHALEVMGLSQHEQRSVTALSGGEKRRLSIATVLAQDPCIYLLDEPMNHLDPHHQINLLRHLKSLQHTAIMLSLHDANLAARVCDYVLLLLPDGSTQAGPAAAMLTARQLEQLYGYQLTDAIALGMINVI